MGGPADIATFGVVHSVVINEKRHTKDIHRHLSWGKEHDTHGSILSLANIEDVVFRCNSDPFTVEHDIYVGVLCIATGENRILLLVKSPGDIAFDTGEEVGDERLVVGGRNDHGGRAGIDDAVEALRG